MELCIADCNERPLLAPTSNQLLQIARQIAAAQYHSAKIFLLNAWTYLGYLHMVRPEK